jgi:hypothetical protein
MARRVGPPAGRRNRCRVRRGLPAAVTGSYTGRWMNPFTAVEPTSDRPTTSAAEPILRCSITRGRRRGRFCTPCGAMQAVLSTRSSSSTSIRVPETGSREHVGIPATAAAGRAHPCVPPCGQHRLPPTADATVWLPVSGSIGKSATRVSCRRGPGTSTPAAMAKPCCSRLAIVQSAAHSAWTASKHCRDKSRSSHQRLGQAGSL